MSKVPFKSTSFEMSKFSNKTPINVGKFYDSEGATQLLMQSDHFAIPAVCMLPLTHLHVYHVISANVIIKELIVFV